MTPPLPPNIFKIIGARGGKISASRKTPEQRSALSSTAGNATLRTYGSSYYSFLGQLSMKKRRLK